MFIFGKDINMNIKQILEDYYKLEDIIWEFIRKKDRIDEIYNIKLVDNIIKVNYTTTSMGHNYYEYLEIPIRDIEDSLINK